jgi:glutamyl-Q tRNA(Asp) synthetase
MTQALVTRFAPSPTGLLHLGHAAAALFAWQRARAAGGSFLLRIEDIDATRCRNEFATALLGDLAWLGIAWDGAVRRQSAHLEDYRRALGQLSAMGLLYPCFCTRAEIAAEIAGAGAAPHGAEAALYPGTCRRLAAAERQARIASGAGFALRLDVAAALARTGTLRWTDELAGEIAADPASHGDVVLARKEIPTSYHLAVTLDDALQGVTLVTRGADLFGATHVHRLLQALLELPVPRYHHHKLLTDASGRRYAKRDRALTLAALRQAGHSPEEVCRMAGFGYSDGGCNPVTSAT